MVRLFYLRIRWAEENLVAARGLTPSIPSECTDLKALILLKNEGFVLCCFYVNFRNFNQGNEPGGRFDRQEAQVARH